MDRVKIREGHAAVISAAATANASRPAPAAPSLSVTMVAGVTPGLTFDAAGQGAVAFNRKIIDIAGATSMRALTWPRASNLPSACRCG